MNNLFQDEDHLSSLEFDSISDLVEYCEATDRENDRLDSIRSIYGSEIDESTGQEIVGGNICIEDVDFI